MKQIKLIALAIIVAVVSLKITTGDDKKPKKKPQIPNAGTISGTIKYSGPAPKQTANGTDTDACGNMIDDASLSVKDGRLANALVYLKKVKNGKDFTKDQFSAVSDQQKCVFTPSIALVAKGGTVEFKNSDNALHNVKSTSLKNPQFNEGVEAGKSLKKIFNKGHETIKISCAVHGWMEAWVVVMAHPYYAVTDAEGNFKLSDVPPGKYKLIIWHGSLGKDCEAIIDGGKSSKQAKSGFKIKLGNSQDMKIEASYKK